MIESIKATNFQSLQDVELEFGKFTVIVGASSGGKSALTRAMKAVASNSLDSDNITRGFKQAAVTLKTDEDVAVTIERTGNGSSIYKIAKGGGKESSHSKLNRSVPTEVTEVLGIAPSTKEVESINFAGQFDTPYLLKDGGSAVARILGELTNVSKIFSAVKEASRRAKNASGLVNLRKKDLDKVIKDIGDYAEVGKQAKIVTSAEEKLSECLRLEARALLLEELLDRAQAASEALSGIDEIKTLPDTAKLEKAQSELNKFKAIMLDLVKAKQTIDDQTIRIEAADKVIRQSEDELHETLVSAGQCPTCNQEITT